MLRPLPLRPGSPIAVVAPASAPRDLDRYQAGLAQLRSHYEVRTAWTSGQERGYLAAPDSARTAALHEAIRDADIRAIICVRGGYGCLRLLPHLDWTLARTHPTLLVGYSDVTALHLAFYARAEWTGLSGPVVTEWGDIDAETTEPFRALAEGETPTLGSNALSPLCSGTATGPLLGGNLSVLTRLVGTPYAPDWEGALLVLEDVAEAPYRIDRMFAHLQHAGVLDAVSGVILGTFRPGEPPTDRPTLSLDTVISDYFEDRPYPVATGLPYGHLLPRCSLPIGVPAALNVEEDTSHLQVLQSIVAE
ncbi:LD-carboxypeptidase [Salinibacter sp. 10B]|nr:LD-carboxypeptidase [Salinibacter sp. 10B]